MAHYLTKNSSRFLYSHASCFLPVYGMDKILKQESMVMRFHMIRGKQVTVHQAMHYCFRSPKMEKLCMYEYFRDIEFVPKSAVRTTGQEYFEFTEEHPLSQHTVAVYRTKLAVPVFPWNWLGSTKSFASPMYIISQKEDVDFQEKEAYAYQFMILFLPFRTNDDLIHDECYQGKWKQAYDNSWFTPEKISVAINIQNIYNSLESQMPPNALVAETDLVDIDETAAEDSSEEESNENMQDIIADFFASTSGETEPRLKEETMTIDRNITGRMLSKHSADFINGVRSRKILNSVTY